MHISKSIESTNFVLGTNTQQYNVHLIMKMNVTLTDDGHRRRPKVTKKELMVICLKLLHITDIIPGTNVETISDI